MYKIQNNFLNFFQRLEVPFFCLKLNFRMFLNVFKLFYMRFNIFLKVFEKILWRSVHSASFGVHSASFGVHSASQIFILESYLKWSEAPQTTKIWSLDCFATLLYAYGGSWITLERFWKFLKKFREEVYTAPLLVYIAPLLVYIAPPRFSFWNLI